MVEKLDQKIRKNYPGLPNSRWIAMRLMDADVDIIKALKNGDFDQVLT
jgi:ferrous iron transport protein B